MPTSFTYFGITVYFYGFFIGLAMLVVAKVSEVLLKRRGLDGEVVWDVALWIVLAGLVGARVWHVATDWSLYQDNGIAAVYIWNGGMSILGGLVGGFISLFLCNPVIKKRGLTITTVSDALAVGLPFGQAVGRLGNWINQELYGFPTDLPWKLFITPEKRVEGFEQFSYFHPLFAYEALALLVVGGGLWRISAISRYSLGRGVVTGLYVLLYSVLRFFLEFLRIEKTTWGDTGLGVNQLILAGVAILTSVFLFNKYYQSRQQI